MWGGVWWGGLVYAGYLFDVDDLGMFEFDPKSNVLDLCIVRC